MSDGVPCQPVGVRHQLRLLNRQQQTRQHTRVVQHLTSAYPQPSKPVQMAVRALQLVESAARPPAHRALEHIAHQLKRHLTGTSRLTVGPFQIRDGPFRLEEAVNVAVERVAALPQLTPDRLANLWNGPATATTNTVGTLNYTQCLSVALTLVSTPRLPRPTSRYCGHSECVVINLSTAMFPTGSLVAATETGASGGTTAANSPPDSQPTA